MDELAKVKVHKVDWVDLYDRAAMKGSFDIDGQQYECEVAMMDIIAKGKETAMRESILAAKPVWNRPYASITYNGMPVYMDTSGRITLSTITSATSY